MDIIHRLTSPFIVFLLRRAPSLKAFLLPSPFICFQFTLSFSFFPSTFTSQQAYPFILLLLLNPLPLLLRHIHRHLHQKAPMGYCLDF